MLKISAVIPTYNRPGLLTRAIGSVLAQTRPVDEIIVVDDGSTAETAQAVKAFGNRIRYVYQKNRGLAGARNTGIRAATGEWIALLDDDDEWLPCTISQFEEAARNSPDVAVIYSSCWVEDSEGKRRVARVPPADQLWPALRRTNFLAACCVLVRKQAALDAGGFDETIRVCEDWDLWVRLRLKHPFAAVLEPLAIWHHTSASLSRDADRMLATTERILDTTLLSGLHGLNRSLWRRRIWSAQLAAAAITAKEANSGQEPALLYRSLAEWPFPSLLPWRYAALARVLLGEPIYRAVTLSRRREPRS